MGLTFTCARESEIEMTSQIKLLMCYTNSILRCRCCRVGHFEWAAIGYILQIRKYTLKAYRIKSLK